MAGAAATQTITQLDLCPLSSMEARNTLYTAILKQAARRYTGAAAPISELIH
jgi:hypothetical protein